MALVELVIGGRSYKITCENGEEQNLLSLAQYIDSKTKELTDAIGHVSEPLLLVLTSLQIADELREAKSGNTESSLVENNGKEHLQEFDEKIAHKINQLANKIYTLAQNLENS